MIMAETSTFGILHGQNVRGRNVLAEMSVAETSVAEISYIQLYSEVELSPFKMSEEEITTQVMIPFDNFLQVTYNSS